MNSVVVFNHEGQILFDGQIVSIEQDGFGSSTVRMELEGDAFSALHRWMFEGREAFNHEGPLIPKIKKVIFNNPATIVLWKDGTKTVVKCGEEDHFDPEKGLAMAIAKKALGNKWSYYNIFKKWIAEDEFIDEKIMKKIADSFAPSKSFDDLLDAYYGALDTLL